MSDLSTRCACGHFACYHPSAAQQAVRLAGSNGRYPGECKGGVGVHCRCITSRDQILKLAQRDDQDDA